MPPARLLTPPARLGFTLVEMLVVIIIVLAVTALAIGVAMPDLGQKRLREAARQVSAFVQGAKARASETGRGVAVILEPDLGERRMVRTLKYADVPAPYAGDSLKSYAIIQDKFPAPPGSGLGETALVQLPADVGWVGASEPLDLIHPGDMIRFNFQGHSYAIIAVSADRNNPANSTLMIRASGSTGAGSTSVVVQPIGLPMAYQVTRLPVPSAVVDLELPESVVIDLSVSGPEGSIFPPATQGKPIIIVFSPGGALNEYHIPPLCVPATGPMYLMVGRREQVEVPPPSGNVGDFQTLWVAINNQTGLVTSVENAGPGSGGNFQQWVDASRDFARKAQTLGGR
jgi:prepilin-type N-terminal cleavage/methylation domain-containing protein